ncbi:glycosyltransferase [Stieleria sp. JC731]|nr:glycosyltransferase [Stieleria sp. JC731]
MTQRQLNQASESISLILPAYNEEAVIATAISEAVTALQKLTTHYEIIVVDDGSSDRTAAIVEEHAQRNSSVRLVRHSPNRGYGAAIRSGFAVATCDFVAFTDADCQFDLNELDRLLFLSRDYDVVCGYRIDRQDSFLRCFYSKVYNVLVRCLLGTEVRDIDCALKLFRRDVVKDLEITGNGFLVNAEILVEAKRKGCSVVEVGVTHRPRTAGESTVSIKHIPQVLTQLLRYWWNRVQFPAMESLPSQVSRLSISDSGQLRLVGLQILLLVFATLLVTTNLGYPLIDRDETRYAEIPREMIGTGNWVLPQLNFRTYYDKPPLTYWLCAISYKCFGVSESSARLVPAAAALLTLAMTMAFASRVFDRRVGLSTGIVLFLSAGFLFSSRYLLLDGVLTAFVAGAMFTAYEAISPSSRSATIRWIWWTLSAVMTGLAFLTKGPVVLVLGAPCLLAYCWISESCQKPTRWQVAWFGLVAATITLPWFVLVHRQDPNFLMEFFYKHNVARFAGAFHEKPIWFFIPVLLIAGHPWSFLTVPYIRFLLGRDKHQRNHRPQALGFVCLWAVWTFAFFSISKCKLPTYLLPAAPAFAMMMGHFMSAIVQKSATNESQANESQGRAKMMIARVWSPRAALLTTCFVGIGFATFQWITASQESMVLAGWLFVWAAMIVFTMQSIVRGSMLRYEWPMVGVTTLVLATMVFHQSLPAYSYQQTLLAKSSTFSKPLLSTPDVPIATVSHEFSEVPFYLKRSDVENYSDVTDERLKSFVLRSERCYMIVKQSVDENELAQSMPVGTRITKIAQQGTSQLFDVMVPETAFRLVSKQGNEDSDRTMQ